MFIITKLQNNINVCRVGFQLVYNVNLFDEVLN